MQTRTALATAVSVTAGLVVVLTGAACSLGSGETVHESGIVILQGEVFKSGDRPAPMYLRVAHQQEIYFTDFAVAAPSDEVCDVAFPIE